jgi:hypothetical protein
MPKGARLRRHYAKMHNAPPLSCTHRAHRLSDWSDLRYERVLWLAAPADMFARRRVRVVWDFLRGVVAAEPELFGPGNR